MGIDTVNKTKNVFAFTGQGTALGTSSVLDTSGFEFMQVMSIHGGTGGSRTLNVFANAGTQTGTSGATFPNAVWIGSAVSDFAGLGAIVVHVGSLTHQAIISIGTSSNSSFAVSYKLYE